MRKSLIFLIGILTLIVLGIFLLFNIDVVTSMFVKKPGSCLVLEEKYCSKGITLEDTKGRVALIGFKVPSGTPIFAYTEGKYVGFVMPPQRNEQNTYVGVELIPSDDRSSAFIAISDFGKSETGVALKGRELGNIGSKELKNYGPYNLVIYFEKRNNTTTGDADIDLLKTLFKL